MSWWMYPVIVGLFVLAIWGFLSLAGLETRFLSTKTTRRADDLYDEFADDPKRAARNRHTRH